MPPSLVQNIHASERKSGFSPSQGRGSSFDLSAQVERRLEKFSDRINRTMATLDANPVMEDFGVTERRVKYIISRMTRLLGDNYHIIPNERIHTLDFPENDPRYVPSLIFKGAAFAAGSSIGPIDQYTDKFHEASVGIFGENDLLRVYCSRESYSNRLIYSLAIQKIQDVINQLNLIFHKGYLLSQNIDLQKMCSMDALTGIANRCSMNFRMDDVDGLFQDKESQTSMVMLDIDRFKSVNDTYGHPVGDIVLRQFAQLIVNISEEYFGLDSSSCRYNIPGYHDEVGVFRLGGEEFNIIIPNCDSMQAKIFAESLRQRIHDYEFKISEERYLPITASVGIATADKSSYSGKGLLERADIALYSAKNRGRDRVVGYSNGLEKPKGNEQKEKSLVAERREGPRTIAN